MLESFLLAGFDPERDGLRSTLKTDQRLFLQMPSTSGNYTGTKLLTISPENATSNLPVIQGLYALFGGPDQRRWRSLASLGPKNLLIFGTGPQAWEHIKAFSTVPTLNRVGIMGRNPGAAKSLSARAAGLGLKSKVCSTEEIANADLIICCTGSAEPLFDGSQVKDTAVVIAIELDEVLMAHASICVESIRTSQLEAGGIIQAIESGAIEGPESLITLADIVSGHKRIPHGRPAGGLYLLEGWSGGVVRSRARCLMARSAYRHICVEAMLSWPRQSAMTEMSTIVHVDTHGEPDAGKLARPVRR